MSVQKHYFIRPHAVNVAFDTNMTLKRISNMTYSRFKLHIKSIFDIEMYICTIILLIYKSIFLNIEWPIVQPFDSSTHVRI